MRAVSKMVMLLQLIVITAMSLAAYYAFHHTETVYQIEGLCLYRYVVYAITVVLGYICFSQYKKGMGIAFSIALSAVAFSPHGHRAIELFPTAVPYLAVAMGATTILLVPRGRGRGFFEFLLVLALPAILAVSRIGGSDRLLATAQSPGYCELSAITVILLGGYCYLRYAASANVSGLGLLSNGGNEGDVRDITKRCNITTILIAICAAGAAAFLMVTAPIVASALRVATFVTPLRVLALAMGAGMAIIATFYLFQLTRKNTDAQLHMRS